MGGAENKVFLPLGELSVIAHSLRAFESSAHIDAVYVAVRPGDEERMAAEIDRCTITKAKGNILLGGEKRFHSVRNGLEAMAEEQPPELVLIHDGARPFLDEALIRDSMGAASRFGGAVVGYPMVDTAKEVGGGKSNPIVLRTLDRSVLWQVQTPQAFRFTLILAAYRGWNESQGVPTDDAAVAEAAGHEVRLVPGHRYNLKITTDLDLQVARAFLERGIWSAA
jgi:2-C-methyl-D-erythritol 4-phosphate cytidylyltransferase